MSDLSGSFRNQMNSVAGDIQRQASIGWTGKGQAPSRSAAIAWAISRGVPKAEAERLIRRDGSRRELADDARRAVSMIAALKGGGRRISEAPPAAAPTAGAPARDVNNDGRIDAGDITASATGGTIDEYLGGFPAESGGSGRGAPLWPFDTSMLTPEESAALTVESTGTIGPSGMPWQKSGGRTPPLYFEADLVAPVRWSAERRADLQRLMHELGLYGDQKIRLGSWTSADQKAFATVLEQSNMGGTRYVETLARWRKNGLPEDIAAALADEKAQGPKRPTIQVANPLDIRQTAEAVSQRLTGEVDRGFAQSTVGPYQSADAAAQGAVYNDQDAGGGGRTTQAPSIEAFAEDRLRREKPIEVDGYQFLGQFQNFLSMIGAS